MEELYISNSDKNLYGMRFNHFKVIGKGEESIGHNIMWMCRCDCGRTVYVRLSELLNGRAKSCGCCRYHSRKPKNFIHVWISKDDQDIVKALERVENAGDYIKQLIREDIARKELDYTQSTSEDGTNIWQF